MGGAVGYISDLTSPVSCYTCDALVIGLMDMLNVVLLYLMAACFLLGVSNAFDICFDVW
mgnify:CR=1 FL=1